jgi:hypothetical protein
MGPVAQAERHNANNGKSKRFIREVYRENGEWGIGNGEWGTGNRVIVRSLYVLATRYAF